MWPSYDTMPYQESILTEIRIENPKRAQVGRGALARGGLPENIFNIDIATSCYTGISNRSSVSRMKTTFRSTNSPLAISTCPASLQRSLLLIKHHINKKRARLARDQVACKQRRADAGTQARLASIVELSYHLASTRKCPRHAFACPSRELSRPGGQHPPSCLRTLSTLQQLD